MENKKILLKTGENEFYDKTGKRFWIAQYNLSCIICNRQGAAYFTIKSYSRYCDNCVTILSLKEVFSAQLEVEKRREKALQIKEDDTKRLAQEELEYKARLLYEAFMDYHRIHNQYIKPTWDDAVESDKDHFYHMADYLKTEEL